MKYFHEEQIVILEKKILNLEAHISEQNHNPISFQRKLNYTP